MAGHDHKVDTRGNIANFIEQKVRDLLEYDMNEYQDTAWIQAAELFSEVVVPCESYHSERLRTLATDIVKEAENHGCYALYQKISGTFNEKVISGDDCSSDNVEKFHYSKTVDSIKAWIAKYEEFEEWFKSKNKQKQNLKTSFHP